MSRRTQSLHVRLWSKIQCASPDECWIWTGRRTNGGYGSLYIRIAENRYSTTTAHRAVYEEIHGPLASGMEALHRCDVRLCCNPAHLFAGTQRENIHDMIAKGRQASGEKVASRGNTKLSDTQVAEIRALYVPFRVTYKMLAERFGVHDSTICNLVRHQYRT